MDGLILIFSFFTSLLFIFIGNLYITDHIKQKPGQQKTLLLYRLFTLTAIFGLTIVLFLTAAIFIHAESTSLNLSMEAQNKFLELINPPIKIGTGFLAILAIIGVIFTSKQFAAQLNDNRVFQKNNTFNLWRDKQIAALADIPVLTRYMRPEKLWDLLYSPQETFIQSNRDRPFLDESLPFVSNINKSLNDYECLMPCYKQIDPLSKKSNSEQIDGLDAFIDQLQTNLENFTCISQFFSFEKRLEFNQMNLVEETEFTSDYISQLQDLDGNHFKGTIFYWGIISCFSKKHKTTIDLLDAINNYKNGAGILFIPNTIINIDRNRTNYTVDFNAVSFYYRIEKNQQ